MLSFGGLLSEVLQGGATGLTASNPSIVKVLGGFVFPVGLVMFAFFIAVFFINIHSCIYRIVLQGQELLTSNMMVSFFIFISKKNVDCRSCRHSLWPLLNVLFHGGVSLSIGSLVSICSSMIHTKQLRYCRSSLVWKLGWKSFLRCHPRSLYVFRVTSCLCLLVNIWSDTAIVSTQPYIGFIQDFAMYFNLRFSQCHLLLMVSIAKKPGRRSGTRYFCVVSDAIGLFALPSGYVISIRSL